MKFSQIFVEIHLKFSSFFDSTRFFFLDDLTGFEITYLLEVCSHHVLYLYLCLITQYLGILKIMMQDTGHNFIPHHTTSRFASILCCLNKTFHKYFWLAAPRTIQLHFHMVCCCASYSLFSYPTHQTYCEGRFDLKGRILFSQMSTLKVIRKTSYLILISYCNINQ